MKNYKLLLMGFALVLLITSCKKEDVKQLNTAAPTSASAANGSWNSLNNWSTIKTDDSTVTHFSQIQDTAINAAVAQSGLVLVFKKEGEIIQSLPFQNKSTGTYWYYQISRGALRIDGSTSVSQGDFNGQNFSYFVFTPEQISNLEAKGKTKLELMQLTYDQALSVLK